MNSREIFVVARDAAVRQALTIILTAAGYNVMAGGARFGLIVHHTDAEREYAYDRNSASGRLDKALDIATMNHWVVVDMKNDWKRIFPSD